MKEAIRDDNLQAYTCPGNPGINEVSQMQPLQMLQHRRFAMQIAYFCTPSCSMQMLRLWCEAEYRQLLALAAAVAGSGKQRQKI